MSQSWSVIRHVVAAVIILAIGFACFIGMGSSKPPARSQDGETKRPLVYYQAISDHQEVDLEVDGEVVPVREISVAAQVAGEIVYKDPKCETGEEVTTEMTLVKIDRQDYEIEKTRLIEQKLQAKESLNELTQEIRNSDALRLLAAKDVKLASKEYKRIQDLKSSRAVSAAEIDRAEKATLIAANALASIENSKSLLESKKNRLNSMIDLADIQLKKAALDLERTEIKSPIAGVITEEFVEAGGYAQKGSPLFKVLDNSRVEVLCRLQSDQLYWIWNQPHRKGQRRTDLVPTPATVEFHISGREDVVYRWKGILERYDGVGFDRATGTAPCRVVVQNPREAEVEGFGAEAKITTPPQLYQGMHVSINIHTKPESTILRIPVEAIRQPGNYLWKLTRDKSAKSAVAPGTVALVSDLRLIRQIEDTENKKLYWLVDATRSSLSALDEVVVSPLTVAKDNQVRAEAKQ